MTRARKIMMGRDKYVILVSLTPFDEKGRIDETAFRQHLRRLAEPGIAVYVASSGSSEGQSFSYEERERVLAIAVEELKGKVPVAAMGLEPHVPDEMVEFLRRAEHHKLDFAQVCSLDIGHGAKPTLREMEQYYSTVLEASSIPVYISTHQALGYFLPVGLIEKLVDRYPTVVGVAYGGPDIAFIDQLIRRVGDRVDVVCAGAAGAASVFTLGGNGFMGGEGNFSPKLVASVVAAFEAGDRKRMRESFSKLMAFTEIQKRYGGSVMRAMKPLLNAYGLPGGYLRAPRLPITDEELKAVIAQTVVLDLPGLPPPPTS
jgi:4-hydroxy-tetrahydrodipicolinate synthase